MNTFIGADAAKLAGLQVDLLKKMRDGKISLEDLGRFVRGELVVKESQNSLPSVARQKTVQQQLKEWKDVYKKYFSLELGEVQVSGQPSGFDRLIVAHGDLAREERPLNWVYSVCAKHFTCWRYTQDLDKSVTKNDREAKDGTYAIWVRDRVEADEENKNLSAKSLAEQKILGQTLLERLLHELKFWEETRKHLDVQNWTLCSGSRRSDGGVPGVVFGGLEVFVYCCDPDGSGEVIRARSVSSSS